VIFSKLGEQIQLILFDDKLTGLYNIYQESNDDAAAQFCDFSDDIMEFERNCSSFL
jgi:hypothetical protein